MKQMAALFKRGDKETADRVREGVKLIVNMAFMGRASEVYAHLTNPTRKYVTLFVSCSIPYFGRLEEGAHLGWLTL
jgi:hypothetical protein